MDKKQTSYSSARDKFTRSRVGCLNCRVQKKKCNEAHPTCSRCERLQRQCVWPSKKVDTRDLLEAHGSLPGDSNHSTGGHDAKASSYTKDSLAAMMRSRNEEEHQNPGGLSLSQVEQERQARQQHQPPRASSSTSPYERPSSIGSSAGGPATPSGLDMLTKISMDPSSAALPSPASHVPSPPQPSTSALTATATTAPIPSSSAPPPPPPDLLGDSVWNSEPQEWPLIESNNPTEDYDWGFIDQSLNFLMEPAGGLLDTSLFEPWKEPQPNQPARITADFIRVLIHYTGTVGYRCFITQFQDSVIPAYRASPMLWATARAYHGSYMRQLFSQQANKRDASEHPARAVAIQAMEKELQEVVKNANAEAPEGDDSTNETEASMLIREGEALLQATLHSSAAAPSISFKEILGTLLNMVGYSHTVEGSVPFWRAADRCIEFVQRYQPAKPAAFDVGAAMGLEYRPLCVWISLDVASAVARGTEMNSTYVQHTVVQEPFKELQGLEWLTKASDAIFVVVAQAAALAHELKGRPPRPGPEQERAEGIWRAINDSTSVVNPSYVSSRVICLIFHELWREGLRIYFHQCVYKRNLLYPALRASVDSCLSLIALLETSRRSAPPALALPLWMAAAAAVTAQERHRFRGVFRGLGPSASFKETLEDLEKIWELTDANGDPQNWPDLVRQGIIRAPGLR